jgi:hypothetical protein
VKRVMNEDADWLTAAGRLEGVPAICQLFEAGKRGGFEHLGSMSRPRPMVQAVRDAMAQNILAAERVRACMPKRTLIRWLSCRVSGTRSLTTMLNLLYL